MRYYFEEEMRLVYNEGTIYEEDTGAIAYTFKNQKMMVSEVHLYTEHGLDLGYVKSIPAFLHHRFEIWYKGEFVDQIDSKNHWTFHELLFEELGWRIEGNFSSKQFRIHDENGFILCDMEKDSGHFSKHYHIGIYDDRDTELLLLIVLCIYTYCRENEAAAAAAA